MQALIEQEDALQDVAVSLEASGVTGVDLVRFLAALPAGVNRQIQGITDDIRERNIEVQVLITEEGKTEDHPQVRAVRAQLATRESELRSAVGENLVVLSGRIENEQIQLNQIRADQANFPELENRLDELNIQLGLDQETVRFLTSQQYQAQITSAAASAYVTVVDSASDVYPVSTGGQTNLLLGAILGLILGVGAAFFLEYLDRTVRTSADVEMLLSIPVLGIIPRLRKIPPESEADDRQPDRPLLVALDPLDRAAEAYRNLRMNIMFMSTEEKPIRTLIFSSPGPGRGEIHHVDQFCRHARTTGRAGPTGRRRHPAAGTPSGHGRAPGARLDRSSDRRRGAARGGSAECAAQSRRLAERSLSTESI